MNAAKGKQHQKRVIAMPQFQSFHGQDSNSALTKLSIQDQAKMIVGGATNSNIRHKDANERYELDSDCNVDLEEADELNSDRGADQVEQSREEQQHLEQ